MLLDLEVDVNRKVKSHVEQISLVFFSLLAGMIRIQGMTTVLLACRD
jgi:hypothetical protein